MELTKTKVSDGPSGRAVPEVTIRQPSLTSLYEDMLELCGYGQDGVSEEDAAKRVRNCFMGTFTVKYQHEVRPELAEAKPEELDAVKAKIADASEWTYVAKPRELSGKPKKPRSARAVARDVQNVEKVEDLQAIIKAAQEKLAAAGK